MMMITVTGMMKLLQQLLLLLKDAIELTHC